MSFYDDASWLLIPSGIEEDIVFAQKPISGLGDLTFTRASDATYTDSAGVVRRSPYNLFQQSEMFSNAIWSKSASTIGIDSTLAPNGTLTADKLQEDSSNGTHLINQPVTNSNSLFSLSIYAKKSERDFLHLQAFGVLPNNFTYVPSAYFNLNTGVVSSVSNANATIESVGNGWYRCTLNCTSIFPQTSASVGFYIMTSTANGVNSYVGTTGSGIFIWGAQVSTSTSALDYFPTTDRLNVPRIDFRNADGTLSSCGRLLLEPQRTNSIRNSSMVGAVAGSPGTLPTNWGVSAAGGLTTSVVAIGTENGLPYVDLRINGTATGTAYQLRYESTTNIIASVGQVWTGSAYIKKITEPAPPLSYRTYISEHNAAGTELGGGSFTINPTISLQRFAQTRTLANASTERVLFSFFASLTNGAAYDFTVRIAAPQMELGAYATTWVPTTTAAVTRIKDDAQKTGVSSIIGQSAGTIFWDINDLTGTPTSTGNPDFAIRNTAFTNWIGVTTNSFASPFRVVVRPTSGSIIDYTANINRAKAAVAWSSAGAVLYVNGAQVGTSAVNPNFSFDIIQMLGGIISYKTNQAALFPTRLSNSELAQLTTL